MLKDDVIDIACLLGIKCAIRLQKNEDGELRKREETIQSLSTFVVVIWEVAMGGTTKPRLIISLQETIPPNPIPRICPKVCSKGLYESLPPLADILAMVVELRNVRKVCDIGGTQEQHNPTENRAWLVSSILELFLFRVILSYNRSSYPTCIITTPNFSDTEGNPSVAQSRERELNQCN